VNLADLLAPLLGAVALGPAVLGLSLLVGFQGQSAWPRRMAIAHSLVVLLATLVVVQFWLGAGMVACERELPPLLELQGYRWVPILLVDGFSVVYLVLVALVYVVVRFSLPSFVREPGAGRYWFLVALLGAALWLLSIAGSLDTLYVAWELVGVSSVMLIGFFRRQVRAAQNSLRALVYYRLGDFLVLLAVVLIHHGFHDHRFLGFAEQASSHAALPVALALLGGSLAKSAQLPMSPWLHRAMEGPASSSAIFYGALSVHLGPFLLLRTAPLWLPSTTACVVMAGIGLCTAAWATLVGRTRSDAKTALAYSTMAQIGLMYVELALGWHTLVAVHLFTHAGLRTWQFLRSSSLIQDFQDNPVFAAGMTMQRRYGFERLLPARLQRRVYLAALRLFWIDAVHWQLFVRPFLGLFRWLERVEERVLALRARVRRGR
jgi:NADH-quinone oxidoreductase subunit L